MNRTLNALLILGLTFGPLPAFSQTQPQSPAVQAQPPTVPAATPATASPQVAVQPQAQTQSAPPANDYIEDMPLQDTEVTVMRDNYADSTYVTPSMQNLSKLYWRLGVFNPEDKLPIDNYLIINECDIYQNFYSDDFEWSNVRKNTRQMLKEKAATFPNQFKILVPIDLGRYDMDRGGFDLVTGTAFVNSRRVQVTGGDNAIYTECGQKDALAGYPAQVVLILNKPFTFNFVKVDEHVAQAFLLRKKYNNEVIPRELRNKGFQRLAYARMRVTFVRYQGTIDEKGGRKQAVLYGKLDGIDVFEDLNEEMLLTSINYQ